MPDRLKRYNFRFVYNGGQDSEGHVTDRFFPIDAKNIDEAMAEYFQIMQVSDKSSQDWVLIGTAINGMDAKKFIQRERGLSMVNTNAATGRRITINSPEYPPSEEIPTPEELLALRTEKARGKYYSSIKATILKAMYDGRENALIEKDIDLTKVWNLVFEPIEDEFEEKGWQLDVNSVTRDSGPHYQSTKRDYYEITWKARGLS